MTPTLALALGVPIPFSNLGIVILDFFDTAHKSNALKANFDQFMRFVHEYKQRETLFEEIKLLENNRITDSNNEQLSENDLLLGLNDLQTIQLKFRDKWSTFNVGECLIGIFLVFLCLFTSFIAIIQLLKNNELKVVDELYSLLSFVLLNRVFFYLAVYLGVTFLLGLRFSTFTWYSLLFFNLDLLFTCKRLIFSPRLAGNFLQNLTTRKDYVIFSLVLLIPFTNSFIISESVSLRFLLVSLLYVELANQLRHLPATAWQRLRRVLTFLTYMLIIRFSFVFHVCREEVANKCTQYIFATQLQKSTTDKARYTLFIVFNFICILSIINSIRPRNNPFLLNLVCAVQFVSLFVYNLIELEMNNLEAMTQLSRLDRAADNDLQTKLVLVHYRGWNIYLARLVYAGFFLSQVVQLFLRPSRLAGDKLANFLISFGLVVSLLLAESKLAIWAPVFILVSFLKQYKQNLKGILL